MQGWEKRNEEYLAEIAGDDDLGDAAYCEVLEDLVERAEAMLTAKREELERAEGADDGEG